MADLTGSTIASSYDQLLAMPPGGSDGANLVALTDGNSSHADNTLALQLSTAGIKSTGTLEVAGITTMAGDLRLEDDTGGEYVGIGTPSAVTTYTITMPAAVGSTGQVLETSDGAGTLAWVTRDVGDITGLTAGTNISITAPTGPVPTINVDNPVVADLTGDVTGNADTATTASNVVVADESADTSCYPLFATASSGTLPAKSGSNLTFNSSSGILTATGFAGDVTGNVSGTAATVTGATQASITSCANLTTVGTIGTGVWQGTAVDGTYVDLEGTELKSTGPEAITKYLRADGDGTCSWQTVSATVTIDSTSIGSSTAGSVLFVNSSNQLSQDNDKLFWDATNFMLGIGTASPSSDIGFAKIIQITDANSVGIKFEATSYNSWEIGTGTSSEFVIADGGVGRVQINTSGDVGIGGTPSHNLSVIDASDATLSVVSGDSSSASLYLGDASVPARGRFTYDNSDESLAIYTNNNERMRIDSSGNVGIGVTPETGWGASSEVLELGDSATDKGALAWNTISGADYFDLMYQCYFDGSDYKYTSSSATTRISQRNGAITFDYAASGVADAAFSWSNGMTITDAGLVGVGGVPATKLTVEGAVTLKEQAAADSDTAAYGQIWVKTGTPNTLYFTDDAGTDVQLGASSSSGVTALSETTTVTIDFSSTKLQTLTVTGTCTTLATSNRSAGKEVVLRIYNNGDFAGFTPTTPSWLEILESISSTGVPDSYYGILKLTSWGTADSEVTAELSLSPS